MSGERGPLVPLDAPSGGRSLLPAEVDLCEAVGITADEYLFFQQLSDAYDGTRPREYDLAGVPDVRADPVTLFVVNLVVGVALSALSALLAPKPQAAKPQTPPQLKTADVNGARRYANYENFDSIQQLAVLGDVIPLVFAHRSRKGVGGIRVKTLLLWSQLLSRGTGQQLKALMLLSMGPLKSKPEFAGFAIGDQTLKNYTGAKVALYSRIDGGRVLESDRYPQGQLDASPSPDVFMVKDDATGSYAPWFSGTRTPSTQTQFGAYAPMSNGSAYKLTYELVLVPDDADDAIKEDNRTKRRKIAQRWNSQQGITRAANGLQRVGSLLTYQNSGRKEPRAFGPWGVSDVNSATEDRRTTADTLLNIGDQYLAGSALVICQTRDENIWLPGTTVTYTLRVTEEGTCIAGGINNTRDPYDWQLQRVAIGTVANTRACDVTELGIKSNVWRQMSFPNVNSIPSNEKIKKYEKKNGSIQLGQVNKYIKRFSFFRLQWRELGSESAWKDLSGGIPFAVRGIAPQAQYNFIRVRHPQRRQYEYRFLPVPGAEIKANWLNRQVRLLSTGGTQSFNQDGFLVTYGGQFLAMTTAELCNPQWIKGEPPDVIGGIVSMATYSLGTIPQTWGPPVTKYDAGSDYIAEDPFEGRFYFYEGGQQVGSASSPTFVSGTRRYTRGAEKDSTYNRIFYEIIVESLVTAPTSSVATVSVSGGSGTGATVKVSQWSNGAIGWELSARGTGYTSGDTVSFTPPGKAAISVVIQADTENLLEDNLNPYDAVADYKLYDGESMSHESDPEHEVVYVNEQISQPDAPQYSHLALIGLRLNSTKEWTSFQELSAYVRDGIAIERLCDNEGNPIPAGTEDASQNFPEIAYALLTNSRIGAGALVGPIAVDRTRMQEAARFCYVNGFTWDGVVGARLNLRQWIFENAGFCLLDFTILGGQFSLVPSVPTLPSGAIDFDAKPEIRALFTDGNIRDLRVTWLGPEERQLFRGTVIFREEVDNGFARTRTLTMRLADSLGGNDADPEENFDWTDWCSNPEHVRTFLRIALKLRKLVDHGVTFTTTPAGALGLSPGDYIRLVSEVTHTARWNNGSIDSEGRITSTSTLENYTYWILAWTPGTEGVSETFMTVENGIALETSLRGTVFTLRNSTTTNRVYKIETLTIGQEGFVEIAASYQPLTDDGKLAVLQWSDSDFVTEEG